MAKLTDDQLEKILLDPGIVRNRLKVYSVRQNAQVFLEVQKEYESFDAFLWGYVEHQPIINDFKGLEDIPAKTELSDKISKDLKKRGFKFTGSTIVYAYMQAIGMVNDHHRGCALYKKKF